MEPVVGHQLTTRAAARERLVLVTTYPDSEDWDPLTQIHVDLGPEFRRQYANQALYTKRAAVTYASSSWALDHLFRDGGSAYLPFGSVSAKLEEGLLRIVPNAPEFSRGFYLTTRNASLIRFPWLEEFDPWA